MLLREHCLGFAISVGASLVVGCGANPERYEIVRGAQQ